MLNALRPLLLLTALAVAMPAYAQDPGPAPSSQREAAEARVRQVEREGGRVLQAAPMQRGGREVYRLKVLTPEGRVRVLHDHRSREIDHDPVRQDRFESGRQSPMLRDRPRTRDSDARDAEPVSERDGDGEPGEMPPRTYDGRSDGRTSRY